MLSVIFFFQAEDGIRDDLVTGVQTCALPILDFDCVLTALATFPHKTQSKSMSSFAGRPFPGGPLRYGTQGRACPVESSFSMPAIGCSPLPRYRVFVVWHTTNGPAGRTAGAYSGQRRFPGPR